MNSVVYIKEESIDIKEEILDTNEDDDGQDHCLIDKDFTDIIKFECTPEQIANTGVNTIPKIKQEKDECTQDLSTLENVYYDCDICQFKVNKENQLTIHMRTHTAVNPHTCDICNVGFTKRSNLLLHMRIHSGEKSFKCDLCQKQFYKKATLTVHMLTHSEDTPYTCAICQTRCFTGRHRVVHMHTRKQHANDICNERCNERGCLTRHMCAHTESCECDMPTCVEIDSVLEDPLQYTYEDTSWKINCTNVSSVRTYSQKNTT